MRLPRTVKIGCHTFQVVMKDEIIHNGTALLGMCAVDEQKIYMQRGLKSTRKWEVFLHECFHAIDDIYDMGIGEKRVGHLGVEILKFIRENNIHLCDA